MNKFLKDLEKELNKLKINSNDIKEILADHKEMIDQALNDGLTDEEIELKFGEPRQLAKELKSDSRFNNESQDNYVKKMGSGDTEGYELHKSFPVTNGVNEVKVALVSTDLKFYPHEGESIEVYYKNVSKPELFSVEFENNKFLLKRKSSVKLFNFRSKSNSEIIVKVPTGLVYDVVDFSVVSADVEVQGIESKDTRFKSTSGDYELKGIKTNEFRISTVSGDIELEDFKAGDTHFTAVSGDYELKSGLIEGELRLNTVSGDFEVENVEAKIVDFNSVSGDLDGSEFYIDHVDLKSVSGDVEISNSDKERIIEVGRKKSLSGDIKIK